MSEVKITVETELEGREEIVKEVSHSDVTWTELTKIFIELLEQMEFIPSETFKKALEEESKKYEWVRTENKKLRRQIL